MDRLTLLLLAAAIAASGCSSSQSPARTVYLPAEKSVAAASQAPQCSLVPSTVGGLPNGSYNFTFDVSGISASDAWLVGYTGTNASSGHEPATAHFDGSTWAEVAVPALPGSENWVSTELTGVVEINATDVWAIGVGLPPSYNGASSPVSPIVLHWNGSAWQPVADPLLGNNNPEMIAADAPDDVWIVADTDEGIAPLQIERWNGASWALIPSGVPRAITNNANILAFSPNDVWIPIYDPAYGKGAVLHWDGTSMKENVLPWLGKLLPPIYPAAMSGTSDNDIWIFGTAYTPAGYPASMPYIAHHSTNGGGDEGWSSYVSINEGGGLSTIADFRPGYAVSLAGYQLLLWNGYDRWHVVPTAVPESAGDRDSVIPNTTSFWTRDNATDAALIQCAPGPMY